MNNQRLADFDIAPLAQTLRSLLINEINQKTKPIGSLGYLEEIALQVVLIQNSLNPVIRKPTLFVFAGDHGITQAGVSPYPQTVTAQMVQSFLAGGAAINVFARQFGWQLKVVDAGVNHDFAAHVNLIDAKIAKGTQNFLHQPAMTPEQCQQALTSGAKLVKQTAEAGCNVLAFGEMGIGNTSAASCLMCVLCELPIEDCVGRGTGLDDSGLTKKTNILKQSINKHALSSKSPIQVLTTFGGYEIAMMVGAMLSAAQLKTLLIIDGFIATAALLVAAKMQPNILDYCLFAHCSGEAGHKRLLENLAAKPLLDLGLRLGEGTGAALSLPLLQAAVNILNEMASFDSAGVSGKINA